MSEYVVSVLKKEIAELKAQLTRSERALAALTPQVTAAATKKAPAKKAPAKKGRPLVLRYSDETVEPVLRYLEQCPPSEPQSLSQIEAGSESQGSLSVVLSRLAALGHVDKMGEKRGTKYRFVSWPASLAAAQE